LQKVLIAAVVLLLVAGNVSALEASAVKRALDRGGNWLIEQFDLKEKVFGKGEQAKDVVTVAMCVKALCDNPRDYKETSGPFISEPVKYILAQTGEDGKLKGENAAKLEAYAWVVEALKATKNEQYSATVGKCVTVGRAVSGSENAEIAQLKWDIAVLRSEMAALPKDTWRTGNANVVAKGGPSTPEAVWIDDGASAVALLKFQQKNGSFSDDIRAHAVFLIHLNRCYRAMK